MTFTFISNYMNHHQQPFCDAMYERLGDDFCFIATMPMEKERIEMGWDENLSKLPYVHLLYDEPECEQLVYDSDVVLIGWSEREDIAQKRLKMSQGSNKVTLRVSERIYRSGRYKFLSPRGLAAKYKEHIRFRNDPVYMLCAGAYTAADFNLIRAYPGKLLKWGYFPPFIEQDPAEIESRLKRTATYEIVWAGRFIPLKHPEYMLRLANALKMEGVSFHIHMIGDGEMYDDISYRVSEKYADCITLHGSLKPDEVRRIMQTCQIHIATSNHLEGWGAVINEGMNAGCIEVACSQMGAVPFLIRDNENGLIYRHDICQEMEQAVLRITRNPLGYCHLGTKAYETIKNEWNANVAADRLIALVKSLHRGDDPKIPESGPLSVAPILKSGSDPAIYDYDTYFHLDY